MRYNYFCGMKQAAFYLVLLALCIMSCNDQDSLRTPTAPNINIEDSLKAAWKAQPDSLIYAENLAAFYENAGRYTDAIAVLKQQFSRQKTNAALPKYIAYLFYEADDTLQAINYYDTAFQLAPATDVLIPLGTLYAGKGNDKSLAIANTLRANPSQKDPAAPDYITGIYYSRIQDADQALQFFDRSIAGNYTFTPAYIEKAGVYTRQKKYDQAVSTLDKAILVQNNFPEAYFYKGQNLALKGDKTAAAEAFEKALFYDPNYTEAKEALTQIK